MSGRDGVLVLAPGDEPALAAFFGRHPHTTLFLESNTRRGGLVDRGEVYQGTYAAAFEGGSIRALAGHCWNGNVLLAAPGRLEEVVRTAVAASGRAVSGILGARAEVEAARSALGLESTPAYMDSTEDLFALEIEQLRVPAPLADGRLVCRAPREAELPALVEWRHAYRVETLGESPGAALLAKCDEEIARYQREEIQFVLEHEGRIVAYGAFNASTPSCVQIGGVWTPHALRGKGYGRAVVAGSLLGARRRGVVRSVLFTEVENHAAQAAYRALGYERVGDYGMVMLR